MFCNEVSTEEVEEAKEEKFTSGKEEARARSFSLTCGGEERP